MGHLASGLPIRCGLKELMMDRVTRALFALLVVLFTGAPLAAQAAPNEIHTQGILRDANGDLMAGEMDVVFRIYDSQIDGEMLWEEAVTFNVMDGVFDVLLPADPNNFPFPSELFQEDGRWLSITPVDQGELPRTALSSVPYALQANFAADLQCSGCIGSDEVDFNYASSDAPGGAATNALTANEALVANNVACAGCVTLQAIDAAVMSAENVSYGNEISGLGAVTVQDALDEIALSSAQHAGDMELHGSGGAGNDGAKIRVIEDGTSVSPQQIVSKPVHIFSADTPRVYLYVYGQAASDWEGDAQPTTGGTVINTRCAWTGANSDSIATCTPPDCPGTWSNLGVTGNLKTNGNGTGWGTEANHNAGTASSGYQERSCYRPETYAVVATRCAWTGANSDSIGSCAPPTCPQTWSNLGVTGNVKMGGNGTGWGTEANHNGGTSSCGYQERTCIKFSNAASIPQGVQIWVDGEDQTVAIGDQQSVGAPGWAGSTWGADGATPWETGRLDISQVTVWGVGEHKLQFKTTGESGGHILFYVYIVDPAAESEALPNDNCGGAEALVFNAGVAKVDATTEDMLGENKALDDLSPEGCGGEGGGEVVYAATIEERATINASVSAPFSTRLYVLDSLCQNEAVLACGTSSATTAELDPGTYYIVVDSDAADQTGDFSLTVELEASPLPSNDTCDTMEAIDAGQDLTQVSGTTKWGLDQYSGACGGDGVSDVAYSFEATNQNDDLLVTIDAAFASVLVLRGQNCVDGFQLACSTNGSLTIPGLAPGTYYLLVDGVNAADEGTFTLDVTLN
jgi:hypothetical protein